MTHNEAKQMLGNNIINAINESCLSISAVRNVLYEIDSLLGKMEEEEYQKTVSEKKKGDKENERT